MYTLVSAPVLGFDLVRRPGGQYVASLIRDALALEPEDLLVLAEARSAEQQEAEHDGAWLAISELEQRRQGVGSLIGAVYEAAAQPAAGQLAPTLQALEAAPLGTLSALLRMVRAEVLDWTWRTSGEVSMQSPVAERATSVVCDAVAAAYWYGVLDPVSRRRLAAPWTRATRAIGPRTVDLGPLEHDVTELVQRLHRLDAPDLERLRDVSAGLRQTGRWAEAVHEASWAVHLTGRVRAAAAAQMLGVEAMIASSVSTTDTASGVWNAVSGALAAQTVRDVLADDVAHELLVPTRLALGLFEA